jgi:hypothetical protein
MMQWAREETTKAAETKHERTLMTVVPFQWHLGRRPTLIPDLNVRLEEVEEDIHGGGGRYQFDNNGEGSSGGEGHGAVRRGRVKLGLVGYVNIRGWRAGMTSSSATQTGCEHTSIRLVGCDLKQYRAR